MTSKFQTIALLGDRFVSWGGGIDFLRFCANALALAGGEESIRLIILLPDPQKQTVIAKTRTLLSPYYRMLEDLMERKRPQFYQRKPFTKEQLIESFRNIDGNAEITFYDGRISLRGVLRMVGADVVMPSAIPLGKQFPVPWIGYLYDFQHKYYPAYFPRRERKASDIHFAQMLNEAMAVVVNAHAVKADIEKFYPETKCRIFNLPFSATPIESWFGASNVGLADKYALPKHYFMVSNQFWAHKDHGTAFKALAIFIELTGRPDIHIVCTGITGDYRQPNYFGKLTSEVRNLGLINNIHFLGYIPKKDQIDIMRGAIAVLQPTLFEGGPGGGAVYDAISMGVPAVLTDIPVNREIQDEKDLFFFQAGSAEDMASKMEKVLNHEFERAGKNELMSRGKSRTTAFGKALLEAAAYVTNNR